MNDRELYGDEYVRLSGIRKYLLTRDTLPIEDAVVLLIDAELQRQRDSRDAGDEE